MRKGSAVITIALIVVIIGAVFSIRRFAPDRDGAAQQNEQETGTVESDRGGDTVQTEAPATPTPTQPFSEPVILTPPPPSSTVEPVAPTETPVQTSTPVATPIPVQADASGSFSSDTGTYLNLSGEWKLYTDDAGLPKLQVALYATHYSLRTDEVFEGLELNVNGEIYKANTPAIRYDGKGFISSPLYTFTIDAPGGAMRIIATWHYRGTYSGKELGDITATTTYYA